MPDKVIQLETELAGIMMSIIYMFESYFNFLVYTSSSVPYLNLSAYFL